MAIRDLVRHADGGLSTADAFMYFLTGSMLTIWLGIMVGITWFGLEWPDYEGGMEWGRDLVFISILPYVSKRFSERKQRMEDEG